MPVEVVMPRFSDTMEEGKILKWYKHEGDKVEKGEPLLEVETDKANMEMQSYESGTIQKIMVKEGESAPVGSPIAVIETAEKPTAVAAGARPRRAEAQAPSPPTVEVKAPPPPPRAEREEERVKASPLARRMAEERGVDLAAIQGTGPGGRITEKDVEAFISEIKEARPVEKPSEAPPVGVQEVPLTKMQQTIAHRMSEINATVPNFYATNDVDMTEAVRLRQFLNEAYKDVKVSFNDIIIKAVALALKKFPKVNAFYKNGHFEMHPWVNIGLVVSVEDGLLVPVVRDADKKDIRTIAAETVQLIERTRTEKLLPNDLEGGTFTVSNLGMFGVDDFDAIVNAPQAAILAVGAIKRKPEVTDDDEIEIRERMKLTLTCDHRIVYGAEAAQFLQEVKRLLENPLSLVV